MEVSVDGEKGVFDISKDTSFTKVIESARNYAAAKRRVIVSIAVNGKQLDAREQLDLTNRKLEENTSLDIKTEDPFKLSIAILGELKSHLDNLEKLHIEAAKSINAGKNKEALFILDKCLVGWRAFFISITGVSLITKIDYTTVIVKGETIVKKISSLNGVLVKFADAFAKEDMVKIGDIAEYELKPFIHDWYDALEEIADAVKKLQSVGTPK